MSNFVAYCTDSGEYEEFDTFEEAEAWLKEQDQEDGISKDIEQGGSYIAKITHRSKYVIDHFKTDYISRGEEWPWNEESEDAGHVEYIPVEI